MANLIKDILYNQRSAKSVSKNWKRFFYFIAHKYPELIQTSNSHISYSKSALTHLAVILFAISGIVYTDPKRNEFESVIQQISQTFIGIYFTAFFYVFTKFRLMIDPAWERDSKNQSVISLQEMNANDTRPFIISMIEKPIFTMHLDASLYYTVPNWLQQILSPSQAFYEDLYVIARGSLDIPKISIRSINFDVQGGIIHSVNFSLGSCSYKDFFCLQYLSNRKVGTDQYGSRISRYSNLSSIVSPIIRRYYANQFSSNQITFYESMPNPLGFSAILSVTTEHGKFLILRVRDYTESADMGIFDCTYAGLIDVPEVLANEANHLAELFKLERREEIPSELWPLFESAASETWPLCLCMFPARLYQPEIIAFVSSVASHSLIANVVDRHRNLELLPHSEIGANIAKWLDSESHLRAKDNLIAGIYTLKKLGLIDQELPPINPEAFIQIRRPIEQVS